MKIRRYNTFIMGHISIDENIYQGETVKEVGGAVVYLTCTRLAGHLESLL